MQPIRVAVETQYIPERSDPERPFYFFAYRIRITNGGDQTVQLLSRHWIITDGDGHEEEVRGPGVVGEQPVLEPGAVFEYTSACPLPTEVGTMRGSYEFIRDTGEMFSAPIEPFTLACPNALQ
jgi:ApaG protein